jgi:hypothetical protein
MLVALVLFAVPIATLVRGAREGSGSEPVGLGLVVAAVLIGAVNVFLSFVRPALHRRAHLSMIGYGHLALRG